MPTATSLRIARGGLRKFGDAATERISYDTSIDVLFVIDGY